MNGSAQREAQLAAPACIRDVAEVQSVQALERGRSSCMPLPPLLTKPRYIEHARPPSRPKHVNQSSTRFRVFIIKAGPENFRFVLIIGTKTHPKVHYDGRHLLEPPGLLIRMNSGVLDVGLVWACRVGVCLELCQWQVTKIETVGEEYVPAAWKFVKGLQGTLSFLGHAGSGVGVLVQMCMRVHGQESHMHARTLIFMHAHVYLCLLCSIESHTSK